MLILIGDLTAFSLCSVYGMYIGLDCLRFHATPFIFVLLQDKRLCLQMCGLAAAAVVPWPVVMF